VEAKLLVYHPQSERNRGESEMIQGQKPKGNIRVAAVLILIAGAAAGAFFIALRFMKSEKSEPLRLGTATSDAEEATPPPKAKVRAVDEEMEKFFAQQATSRTAPAAEAISGKWQARFVAMSFADGVPPDVEDVPGFTFTIKSDGGGLSFIPDQPKATPRTLKVQGAVYISVAPPMPDLAISMAGEKLIGVLSSEKPQKTRMEFHATRLP
jgi:hypothetical protein